MGCLWVVKQNNNTIILFTGLLLVICFFLEDIYRSLEDEEFGASIFLFQKPSNLRMRWSNGEELLWWISDQRFECLVIFLGF